MTPERYQQIGQLYHEALERNPAESVSFLDLACGGDAALRKEVESLLAYDLRAEGFIESPAGRTGDTDARRSDGAVDGWTDARPLPAAQV